MLLTAVVGVACDGGVGGGSVEGSGLLTQTSVRL